MRNGPVRAGPFVYLIGVERRRCEGSLKCSAIPLNPQAPSVKLAPSPTSERAASPSSRNIGRSGPRPFGRSPNSFARIGQLQPIIVRPRGDTGFWLVAGRHRLEAAKRLKWPMIRALVLENADEAELAEIDENLIRADLSPAERALHVSRRKDLYEKVAPSPSASRRPGAR